uniref:Uncharacterized protein n=1 Tax=Anguilla anguilla TaxID=7936 RepID=A0A0E9U2E3_ANGAN
MQYLIFKYEYIYIIELDYLVLKLHTV